MIAGGYVLHLYCRYASQSEQSIAPAADTLSGRAFDARHYGGPAEFSAETGADARRMARRRGWRFGRDGDVTCPLCLKYGPGHEVIEVIEAIA